jgi:predicted nuclease of restriction endonuclease-like RecB superfamily
VALLLTSDLLVTRISRGKIKPAYAAFDPENLELARLLIETFEQHVGKTYGDLLAELEGYEEMNYRFIRGLSQLLGRRAVIETDAVVDSSAARGAVFEACGGMALSPAEKKEALQKAAKKLSISVQELEKALWADLEENQVLKSFLPLSPAELLKQYNLSLTQTLLFRAVDLDIWIKGDFQKILWKILRSGLMYSLEDAEETTGKKGAEVEKKELKEPEELKDVHLHLDGPASLFRMSERYGNSFAKLFPTLVRSKGWRLKAGILYKGYQGKRILEFTLDGTEEAFKPTPEAIGYLAPLSSGFQLEEEKEGYETGKEETEFAEKEAEAQEINIESADYDSMLEKVFGSLSLGGWKIKREPTILRAGKYAFVPDFALQRDGMKVYLEIVGFWTPEYLEKKVNKLKEVKEPLILLIDRKLKCSEKDFPAQEVIFFDRKIPTNEVMKVLRKYEEKRLTEDRSTLQEIEIPLCGEWVSLEKIAAEKGVLLDALKEVIADRLAKSAESVEFEESEEFEESAEFEKSAEFEELAEFEESAELEEYGKSGKFRDYVLLENYMIHRQLLERIDLELEKPGAAETYAGAVNVFESFRLDRSLYYPVLEQLGYKVIWTGLSEEEAKIKKVQKIIEPQE